MATEKKGLTSTDLEKMLKGGAPDVDMLSDGLRLAAEEIVRYRKPREVVLTAFTRERVTNQIRDILDKYQGAVARRVTAQINASLCATSHDYKKAEACEDEEATMLDGATEDLFKMLLDAAKHGSL